jgi:hypothetical protein
MGKALLSSTLALCAGLIMATAWLLSTPIPVNAQIATCRAECGGGRAVECSGKYCTAQDGVGCIAGDGMSKSC